MDSPTQAPPPIASPGTPQIVEETPEQRVYDVSQGNQPKQSNVLTRPIILGDLTLASPTTQTTVGSAGAASALPATPTGYLIVNLGNGSVVVPYYAQA